MKHQLFQICATLLLFATGVISAAAESDASIAPESDRTSLLQYLAQKFPGLPTRDWPQDGAALAPVTTAVPLASSNATNIADFLAIGRKRWEKRFANGRRLVDCFANSGRGEATFFPRFDAAAYAVVSFETAVNRCLAAHGERVIEPSSMEMQALALHFRALSTAQRTRIAVPTPALPHYLAGRELYLRKRGPANLACASCHVLDAGTAVGTTGYSPLVGQTLSWPRVEPGGNLRSLQAQIARCFTQRLRVRPPEAGSAAMDNLEYFMTYQSNGLAIGEPLTTH